AWLKVAVRFTTCMPRSRSQSSIPTSNQTPLAAPDEPTTSGPYTVYLLGTKSTTMLRFRLANLPANQLKYVCQFDDRAFTSPRGSKSQGMNNISSPFCNLRRITTLA